MVTAGLEHEKFINLFPSWQVSSAVQEINCKVHGIVHGINNMNVLVTIGS